MSDSGASGYRAALAHRDFRVLMARYVASGIGSWAYVVALISYVYDQTGSVAWVGIVSVARLAPMFVFSTFAGVLAERFERTRVMLVSDLSALVCMLGLVGVAVADAPAWVAVLLASITSVATIMEEPAVAALVPQVVGEDDLAAANGLFSIIANLNVIVGPTVGAGLLAVTTVAGTFAVNAGTFAVAAVLVTMLMVRSTPTDVTEGGEAGMVRQLTVGLRVISANRSIVVLVAAGTMGSFLYGLDTVLFPVLGTDLGLGTNGFGYLLTGLGLGGVLGGVVVARIAKLPRLALVIAVSMAVFSAPTALLVLVDEPIVAFGLQVVRGMAMIVVEVLSITAIQRSLAPEMVSRVFGAVMSIDIGAMVLGAAMAPFLLEAIALDSVLLIVGIAVPALVVLSVPWWAKVDREAVAQLAAIAPRVERLEAMGIFSHAPRAALERLARAAEDVVLPVGAQVVTEGEPADALYVMVSGEVEVTALDETGQPQHVAMLTAPAYFGEIGLLEQIPRTATVTTTSPTTLLRIDGEAFLDVLTNTVASPAFVESSRLRQTRSGRTADAHTVPVGDVPA